MRVALAARAKRNLRSTNAEIVMILASALGDESKTTAGTGFADTAPAVASNETALQGGPITHG